MGKRKYEPDSDTADSLTVKRKEKKRRNTDDTGTEDEIVNGHADTSIRNRIHSPPKKKNKSHVNHEILLDDSLAEVESELPNGDDDGDKIVYWLLRKPKNVGACSIFDLQVLFAIPFR